MITWVQSFTGRQTIPSRHKLQPPSSILERTSTCILLEECHTSPPTLQSCHFTNRIFTSILAELMTIYWQCLFDIAVNLKWRNWMSRWEHISDDIYTFFIFTIVLSSITLAMQLSGFTLVICQLWHYCNITDGVNTVLTYCARDFTPFHFVELSWHGSVSQCIITS